MIIYHIYIYMFFFNPLQGTHISPFKDNLKMFHFTWNFLFPFGAMCGDDFAPSNVRAILAVTNLLGRWLSRVFPGPGPKKMRSPVLGMQVGNDPYLEVQDTVGNWLYNM